MDEQAPTCSHRGNGALLADDVLLEALLQREPPAFLQLPPALLLLELGQGGERGDQRLS